jgi:hypothetical protein
LAKVEKQQLITLQVHLAVMQTFTTTIRASRGKKRLTGWPNQIKSDRLLKIIPHSTFHAEEIKSLMSHNPWFIC